MNDLDDTGERRGPALPSAPQWLISTPQQVWLAAALGAIACLLLMIASFSTLSSSSANLQRMRAANTAISEVKSIDQSTKAITVTLEALVANDEQTQVGLAKAIELIENERTAISATLDTFEKAGVSEAALSNVRSSYDRFLSTSVNSLKNDVTEAEVKEVTRLAQQSTAEGAMLTGLIDDAVRSAAGSASSALWATRIMGALTPLIAAVTAMYIIYTLNARNRAEVAQVAQALEAVATSHDSVGLDAQAGPINAALATSFRVMTTGVRMSMEQLEVWARTSDVERFITESMESVRSRGDISGAVGASFNAISSTIPMELMVLSPDSSRMLRVASNPEAGASGCPVASPRYCPAMRANETLEFPDGLATDACPQLRARGKACAAACVPVRVGQQRIGVIHIVAPSPNDLDHKTMAHVETVADLSAGKLSQVQAFEATWRRATTDQLTALHNRRAFEDRANELLAREVPFILVMADLDHFKRLNDSYGHKTGDEVLKAFARVLRENIRRSDMAARFGGEEFLVLLPEISMTEALVTLDRVRLAFGPTLGIGGLPKTTASFGATRSEVSTTLEGIIRVADSGLYLAKKNGRDRVETADSATVQAVFGDDERRPDRTNR